MTLYYILRDRIPFYLTLIWLYRNQINKKYHYLLDWIGEYFIWVTRMGLAACIYLLFTGQSLTRLVYFKWSFPSPLQWCFLILLLAYQLERKDIPLFDSYYISLMTALGGGWFYEVLYQVPYWVRSGFAPWNWYKFNVVKVFLFEYQIFALPIVYYILSRNYTLKPKKGWIIGLILVLVFYLFGFQIAPIFHRMGHFGGNGIYAWVLRVPVIILLFQVVNGVETK